MKSKIHRFASPSAALFIALVASPLAGAAPLTWDTTIAADATITNGAGTWTVGAGNWNNGTTSVGVNFATGDTVTFGSGAALTAAYTVTLGGTPTTVGSISANYTGGFSYTIGAVVNTQSIAFTGGTGSISVTGAPTNNLIFNAVVAGNFTVTGSGNKGAILLGNGAQTAANTLTVSASTLLQAGSNGTTGSFGAATIVNNGLVNYRRAGTVTMSNAISGGGAVSYQLRAATVNLNTAGTYLGATSISPTAVAVLPAITAASTVNWGVTNALPATTAFTFNPNTNSSITLDLKGFNQTVASLAGAGTVSDSIITTTSGAPTLTVSGTTTTSYGGLLSGNLALTKGNTGQLTLNGVSTYTGNTAINGGTLALGASASISSTPRISIAAGGTFDVSLIPSYTLSASTSLSASGTASPADIKGGTTVDLGSQPLTLTYDGTNPPLTVSQGALSLNGNAFTVNSASPLAVGSYNLISQAAGAITNAGSFSVVGSALSGTVGTLDFSTLGEVDLVVTPAAVDFANSSISASPTTLLADNSATSTVTVTLKNASNVALPGVGMSWAVSGAGNTVVAPAYGTTNGSGVCTFTVRSAKAETKTVSVTVGANTFTTNIDFTLLSPGNAFTWDPANNTSGSDGPGTWSDVAANWANNSTDVAWPNNGNDAAVFGTSGPLAANATVTLGAPVTVGNLTFTNTNANTSQYTITGAGLNILTLAGAPIIDVAANARLFTPIAGTGFAKEGAGVLRVDGNSPAYAGNIALNTGTLQIGNNGTDGDLGTGTITLSGAAVFTVRKNGGLTLNNTIAGSTTGTVGFQLNGGGTVTVAKANTYTAAGGTYLQPTAANTVGTLALGIADAFPATTAFIINSNGATSLQTFDLAGFNQTLASLGGSGTATTAVITSSSGTPTLTVSGTATTTFGGLVSGSLSVSKGGGGSQTLSAANTYSGNTNVTEGTLKLNNPNANNESSTVTIAATAATLELNFDETGGPVTDTVDKLFIGAVQQNAGVYKATDNVTDAGTPIAQITGPGTLTVTSGPGASTPYDDWATIKGLTAGNKAKNLDPDNDGRNNLGEFAFNGDPLSGSDNGKVFVLTEDSDAAGDPSSAKELILTAAVRTGTPVFAGTPSPTANLVAGAITYTIEGSLDLGSFPTTVKVVPTPVVTGLPSAGAGYEYRSFSLDGSNGLTGKGFLRAKVTSP